MVRGASNETVDVGEVVGKVLVEIFESIGVLSDSVKLLEPLTLLLKVNAARSLTTTAWALTFSSSTNRL